MGIIELILIIMYITASCGVFFKGNFDRELAKARGNAEPTSIDERVNVKLWEIRHTFEGLFRDERAKQNALSLFPQLRDLEDEPTGKPVDVTSYRRILLNSALWPIMLPYNFSVSSAHNIVANEQKDKEAQAEQLRILAEHEDDPDLKAAYETGDANAVGDAIYKKAVRDNKAAAVREAEEELLQLEAAKEDPNSVLNLSSPAFTFDYDRIGDKVSNVTPRKPLVESMVKLRA